MHGGTPGLHVGKFSHVGGKAKFIPVEGSAPHEECPCIATTGQSLYHHRSGTMTKRSGAKIVAFYDKIELNVVGETAFTHLSG